MTEWITRPARHIPEDELHAYLDQALSRSQCAEIETHLSACKVCQAQRASVAALRDRTTALLSGLAPRPVIVPPSYVTLRERHSRRLALALWRARIKRSSLWAAAVVAAVGTGWIARSVTDPHQLPVVSAPLAAKSDGRTGGPSDGETVAAETQPAADVAAELERQAVPAPIPERHSVVFASRRGPSRDVRAVVPAPTLQLASVVIPAAYSPPAESSTNPAHSSAAGPFNRIWRAVSWEEALRIAGSGLPYIEGLTVVGVLMQPGAPGERPTVIVAQQDQSGEIIQSIEGPVAKVSELLQRQGTPDMHASEAARTPPDYVESPGGGMRRALRNLIVAGRLPVDSLNALARMAAIR
ncbi:MAG TPA: zf-HC2 domain-containing protein [Gemmatimonadales bacterium]|jgi:hypothetical protein|nr:zf-HC2 domain-containing protein [Gemmatimonadales bacterium]